MTTIQILIGIAITMEEKQRQDIGIIGSRNSVADAWDKAIGIIRLEIKKLNDEKVEHLFLTASSESATGGNSMTLFERLVERRITKIRSTLMRKAKEYASDKDRFHNFKVAALMNTTTPEKALKGMMLKHEVSVLDMINSPEKVTKEMVDEKIGDNINYLILLEGLLKEKI